MDDIRGVLVLSIIPGHKAAFFQANDVIISLNGELTNSLSDLRKARMSVVGTSVEIVIFRNQHAYTKKVDFNDYK
jgi:S1-C subfamily serine protease